MVACKLLDYLFYFKICENSIGHLAEFTLNLWMALNSMDILKTFIPPVYEHEITVHLFKSLIYFISILFSAYKSYTCFVRVLPKYLFLLEQL